jgi:hypothetical protein
MDEYVNLITSKYPEIYTEEDVKQNILPKLSNMTPLLLSSLKKFLTEGELDEINLLGYSVEKLKVEHNMNEVAAYMTLDWIIKEPEEAIVSLKRGHDTVTL